MKTPAYRTIILLLLLCIPLTGSGVTEGRAADPTDQKELFLAAQVSNNKPFTGETISLTYTLFFKGIAPKIQDTATPAHEGMWAEESTPRKLMPSKPERVGDTFYRSTVIKRMTLVPLTSGRLNITGYRVLCLTPKNLSIGSGQEPDDSLTLVAPGITVDVIPLPEPQPTGFDGAVGTFTAFISAEKDTVPSGSSLRLTASINGKGSLFGFPVMPLSLPESFTLIEVSAKQTADSTPEPLSGSLEKMMTIKAEKPGTFIFPPITFTAFDPGKKTYATIKSNKLTLTVLPETGKPPTETTETLQPVAPQKIPQNKQSNVLYRLLFALPFALIVALLYLLLKKRFHSHTVNRKSANSLQELREQLSKAIERRCGFNPRSLTRSELTLEMEKKGVDATLSKQLLALLEAFDRLEFAPGEPDKKEFEEIQLRCAATAEKLMKK